MNILLKKIFKILSKILLDSFSTDFVIIKKKIQIYSWFIISINNQIFHIK